MADNVAITTGSGTTILADELTHATYGLGKAQAIKLLLGAPETGVDWVGGSGANSTAVGRVTIATDDAMMASIRSPGLSASVTVTRPANTNVYAALDVLGPTGGGTASMNFALGAVSGSKIKINSVSLERDVAAIPATETTYVLHLFNVTQPSAQVDEATFDLASGDRTAYLGNITIPQIVDLGSTLYVETVNLNKIVQLSGTGIFGVLVTVGTYTAASASVLKVTINAEQV